MDAVQAIYESVKERTDMSLEAFSEAIKGWEIIPIKYHNEVIGGIMLKDNEIHVGSKTPEFSTRSYMHLLNRLLRQYGEVVTSVMKDNLKGLEFCKRLGFVVDREEQGKIYLKMNECKYV